MTEQTATIPKLEFVEATDEMVAMVDQMGAMSADVKVAKALIAKYEKLRKSVTSLAAETVAPDQSTAIIGENYVAQITEQRMQRDVINKAAIFEAVGNDTFVEIAQFKLTDLDRYLTPHQIEKAVASVNAGPRRLTVTKRDDT
jgi:hypothetical protein